MDATQSNYYISFAKGLEHVYLDENVKGPTVYFEFENDSQADDAFNRIRNFSLLELLKISTPPKNAKHPTIGFTVKTMGTRYAPITDVHVLLTKLGNTISNSKEKISVPVTYVNYLGIKLYSGDENNFDEKMRKYQVDNNQNEATKEEEIVSDVNLYIPGGL